ncbi:MAG: NTP transferase domain-containing protein [Verrucomicrobiota bacterium]|nr:NTP transferase domain-containing protein [Verrucomicrobiota bacterium]
MGSEKVTDAVVLLAGAGSRLSSARGSVPKPLVEILGRPLISYVLRALESVGIRNLHAIVGSNSDEVIAGMESCLPAGLCLNPIHNPEWQKQNGISVLCAAGAVERPFLLAMGDHLFDPTILPVLLERADPSHLQLAVDRRIETIFDLDDAMKVKTKNGAIVEIGKKLTDFDAIDTGLFFCPLALFEYLEKAKVESDCSLADGVRLMAREGLADAIDIGERWWQDVDTPAMLRRAEECLPPTLRSAPQLVAE